LPGIAPTFGKRLEDASRKRLPALFVRHVSWLEPALGGRTGHDLLVHVEVAELLRNPLPDLAAARAGRMGHAHHAAGHEATLERTIVEVKHALRLRAPPHPRGLPRRCPGSSRARNRLLGSRLLPNRRSRSRARCCPSRSS